MGAPSMAGVNAGNYNMVAGQTVRYGLWPVMDGSGATTSGGKIVSAGDGVWSAAVDLVVAADIALDFWICSAVITTAQAIAMYDVQLGSAAWAELLASWKVDITAVTINLPNYPLTWPIYMAGGSAVQVRASTTGGAIKTIYVGIVYATLL